MVYMKVVLQDYSGAKNILSPHVVGARAIPIKV
jgi:hypothetical protein